MTAPRQHVFLSHSSADRPPIEELARRLVREGIEPWLDTWNLIPGDPWQPAIERALTDCAACTVFIGLGGFDPWQHEEMRAAIDRRVADSAGQFRVIPVLLPGADRPERGRLPTFLAATTWVEFRHGLDDAEAFRRLVCGIRGLEPGPAPGATAFEGRCPYRGLEAFDSEHAAFFFGREALTEWLLDALRPSPVPGRENRFLVIVGPSGSGKSSLALAGLVPALRRGGLGGSADWPIVIVRPGLDPIESLAVRLSGLAGRPPNPSEVRQLMTDLADPRSLHWFTRLVLRDAPPARRLVVLVDQFEEVFTLTRDEAARAALIDNLLHAATIGGGQTVVVLTIRADFYGKCAAYHRLADAMSDHQRLVGPMTEDELHRAIERPAHLVGCEFEPGLVERLLHDVEGQAGALPLLQYALLELWQRRDGRRLTVAAYRAIGGLQGALENRADEVLHSFTEPERDLCRRIFLRLTQPGEGTEDTKRRASFQELVSTAGDEEAVRGVVQRLADARLITTRGEQQRPEEGVVEVAHEALIRGWPELRRWIDADRAGLRTHRRLTEAAREWEGHGSDDSYLYIGARLAEAKEWGEAHHTELNPLEANFLAVSLKRAANELEAVRRRARTRARVGILLAGLSLALAGVATFSLYSAKEANRQTRVATVQRLAVQSQSVLETFPQRSLLLAVEAINVNLQRGETRLPPAEQALRQALESTGGYPLCQEGIIQMAISHEGQRLLAILANHTARSWNLDDPAKASVVLLDHRDPVGAIALSLDGRRLVTAGEEQFACGWDLENPSKAPIDLCDPVGRINTTAISPDGRRLATIEVDGIARVWDLDHPTKAPTVIRCLEKDLAVLALSLNGQRLAVIRKDRIARVWDLNDPAQAPVVLRNLTVSLDALALSSDGRRMIIASTVPTSSFGMEVRVWDLDEPTKVPTVFRGFRGPGSIIDFAVSSDGRRLVTAGSDGDARVWDLDNLAKAPIILSGVDVKSSVGVLALSPDGRRLVTTRSYGGPPRVWDLDDPTKAPVVLRGYTGDIDALALSADGRRLVIAGGSVDIEGSSVGAGACVWDLNNATRTPVVFRGLGGHIKSVTFNPDGRRLFAAGYDTTARVWDLDNPAKVPIVLRGFWPWELTYVAISPNSQRLFAIKGYTAQVWDLNAPAKAPVVLEGFGSAYAVRFSPDGRRFISAGQDGDARVWDLDGSAKAPYLYPLDVLGLQILLSQKQGKVRDAKSPVVLHGHKGTIYAVVVSSDGRQLVTAGKDGDTRVWDLNHTAKAPIVLRGLGGAIYAVAFSDDGRRLATAGADRVVQVWDLDNQAKAPVVLRGLEGATYAVSLCFDNRRLVTVGSDGIARMWDLDDPAKTPAVFRGHEGPINALALSPDGRRLVTVGQNRIARVWDLNNPANTPAVHGGHEGPITALTLSPDGRWLITAEQDGTARVWDRGNPAKIPDVLRGHNGFITTMAVSPNGRWLVTAGQDKTVRIWDRDNPARASAVLSNGQGPIYAMAFSPDSQRLVMTAGLSPTASVWNLEDPAKSPIVLHGITAPIVAVAFSPDGRTLIAAATGCAWTWDPNQPAKVPSMLRNLGLPKIGLTISPDGRLLFTVGGDGIAQVWDLHDSAKAPNVLRGYEGRITDVAISPDGRKLVVARDDRTAWLWELDHLDDEPVVLRGSSSGLRCLAISPDSRRLFAGCEDGNVREWPLQLDELIALAGQTAGRNLTHAEWKQYFPNEPYRETFDYLPDPSEKP
jgi:WD40 repeat protein